MKFRNFERKLGQLEKVFSSGEPKDDWIDSVMWDINAPVGCFGHTHRRFSESRQQTELVPCSVDEELQIMRKIYEDNGHLIYVRDPEVSFVKFLEYYCYLGSEELAGERKAIIEKVRGEAAGA